MPVQALEVNPIELLPPLTVAMSAAEHEDAVRLLAVLLRAHFAENAQIARTAESRGSLSLPIAPDPNGNDSSHETRGEAR